MIGISLIFCVFETIMCLHCANLIFSRNMTRSGLSNLQLKDLYSNCIKLSTENVSIFRDLSLFLIGMFTCMSYFPTRKHLLPGYIYQRFLAFLLDSCKLSEKISYINQYLMIIMIAENQFQKRVWIASN